MAKNKDNGVRHLGLLGDSELARRLSAEYRIPLIDLDEYKVSRDVLDLVPRPPRTRRTSCRLRERSYPHRMALGFHVPEWKALLSKLQGLGLACDAPDGSPRI
jgi:hypothetical protein